MKKLHVTFMKDLRNIEFTKLYGDIIKKIEEEQPEDEGLISAFEWVKSHKIKLFEVRDSRIASEITIKNESLTHTRNDCIISLRRRVKSFLLSDVPEKRVAANHINFVLKEYGKKYFVPTINNQTILVDNILFKIKQHKNLKDAFTLLELNHLMGTIETLTREIMINFGERVMDTNNKKEGRKGVRKAAYKDMKIMTGVINSMVENKRENPELTAYIENLVDKFDDVFKSYSTLMKSRNTKRKNKKEKMVAEQQLTSKQEEDKKIIPKDDSDNLENDPSTDSDTIGNQQ